MMEQPGGFVGVKMGRECIPFGKDDLTNKLVNGASAERMAAGAQIGYQVRNKEGKWADRNKFCGEKHVEGSHAKVSLRRFILPSRFSG